MRVPFCDLAARNRPYDVALRRAFDRVMWGGKFILGREVERFEERWADYCGKRYAIGTGNATDAISLMLNAYSIGRGDSVIVPAHTCIATWLAASAVGAVIVPVDVDRYGNIDVTKIQMDDRVKAILAVHMYGRVCDMRNLRAIATAYGIPLLIDAAQAHGITGDDLGDAAAFSFYPTKNLGALGDGGAVVTNDEHADQVIRAMRNLGSVAKDVHHYRGGNSRLDELQAAFLNEKLNGLDADNKCRELNASIYGLSGASVWHQCVISNGMRAEFRRRLYNRGIDTMIHYPIPPHRQQCYAQMNYGPFLMAELIADTGVSLPCGPEVSEEQARYVAEVIMEMACEETV